MLNFNKYVHEGEQFVHEVALETNTPWDTIRAVRILRAVFHSLRNRLPVASSLQLIAQFPMLIKAIYVDGWKITNQAKNMRHIGDFIESVREEGGPGLVHGFTTDHEVNEAIRAVLTVIKRHVSEGEIEDLMATLPAELKPMVAHN
ncbi:MAG: DUF2267 domain-containing protein [Lewinellaceae bacterium]|nr:DUF2267 domain-containing protein [Lewinellaceae bacterium]